MRLILIIDVGYPSLTLFSSFEAHSSVLQTVKERREEQDERERTERRGKKSEAENKGIHHMIRTTTGGNVFVYDEKRTQSDPMIRSRKKIA